jgi:hypothetical protein
MGVNILTVQIVKSSYGFSRLTLLVGVSVFLIVLGLSAPLVSSKVSDQRAIETLSTAERIAKQITHPEASRDVSAVGGPLPRLQDDPWGNPFNSRVIKNAYGQPSRVAVWSNGPNQKNDTMDVQFDAFRHSNTPTAIFGGDDIGTVSVIR